MGASASHASHCSLAKSPVVPVQQPPIIVMRIEHAAPRAKRSINLPLIESILKSKSPSPRKEYKSIAIQTDSPSIKPTARIYPAGFATETASQATMTASSRRKNKWQQAKEADMMVEPPLQRCSSCSSTISLHKSQKKRSTDAKYAQWNTEFETSDANTSQCKRNQRKSPNSDWIASGKMAPRGLASLSSNAETTKSLISTRSRSPQTHYNNSNNNNSGSTSADSFASYENEQRRLPKRNSRQRNSSRRLTGQQQPQQPNDNNAVQTDNYVQISEQAMRDLDAYYDSRQKYYQLHFSS